MGVFICIQSSYCIIKMDFSLVHILILIRGLHWFIPGLIHSYHPDGGAHSIAGFTNYKKSEKEILFFLRALGAQQTVRGAVTLGLLFLILTNPQEIYKTLLWFLLFHELLSAFYGIFVFRITGNTLKSAAPNAPGNWTPTINVVLLTISLFLL